ncbi:MAG: DUF1273 family protein [Clostridia bacterium]|nr:DUF1273 family protein [Clostridia bacterium]
MSRYISLAFTGYRTEKLPFPLTADNFTQLKVRIMRTVTEQAELGVKYFLTGMCRGSDLIAADAVLTLRGRLGLELWCAIPFDGQRNTVPREELALYDRIIKNANGKIVLERNAAPSDYPRLYNERNRYMVNRCDGLIAVCDEDRILPGGTKNTVETAKRMNKKIVYVSLDGIGGYKWSK